MVFLRTVMYVSVDQLYSADRIFGIHDMAVQQRLF